MLCFAAVVTDNLSDDSRIGWLHDPYNVWMDRLESITPHLVIELAKLDGFAREPVRLLFRRVMTFEHDDPDAASAKDTEIWSPTGG